MALIYLGYKALTGKKKGEKDEDGEATPDIRSNTFASPVPDVWPKNKHHIRS